MRSGMLASGSDSNSSLVRSDRRFVTKAAELNTEEIRLSELAAQQASNPEVRAFAQQLVTAHSQATSELHGIAGRKGLDAMARDDYDQRAVTKLSKKSGTDFDKAYLEKMVDAHDDAVDLFQKASRDAKDPELQAFASKMLPDLQQHQQHAKSLEKTISSSNNSSSSRMMGSGSSGTSGANSSGANGAGSSSSPGSGSSSGAGSPGGLTR